MVAAATAIVVGVWSLDGEDAAPVVTAESIASITAPAPEPRSGAAPLPIDLGIGGAPSLSADALPRPPEAAEPVMPDSFERFIVQRGDTIFDISIVFGVSIDEILRFNPDLGDGSSVSVGQPVMVPISTE